MSDAPLVSVGGRPVLTLPPATNDRPSSLVFGMHKGGSSLLNRMVRWMCRLAEQPYVPVMQSFHDGGVPMAEIPPETADIFLPTGYCYGGFRQIPAEFAIPILDRVPQVLLVRDPRDMLTSLYFGVQRVEGGPADLQASRAVAKRLDIDALALETAGKYLDDFVAYERHLAKDRLLALRYEDVIYDKAAFARRVADHIGLPLTDAQLAPMAAKLDDVPESDRPDQHVRQVHPGDHKRKLRPETIAALDERFADVLDRYGYERG
ncbi:MAG: sulfotransferase domain-containing protein [Alphaproteobacteria bacterium]